MDYSAIQHLEISGPDFVGRKFAIVNSERVDTGDGILKGPIMPIPELILDLFGTRATFYLNGVSAYNPETGEVTKVEPPSIEAKIYPESYTLEEQARIPEVLQGDMKVYVSGRVFGYESVALLVLQVRETGTISARIE